MRGVRGALSWILRSTGGRSKDSFHFSPGTRTTSRIAKSGETLEPPTSTCGVVFGESRFEDGVGLCYDERKRAGEERERRRRNQRIRVKREREYRWNNLTNGRVLPLESPIDFSRRFRSSSRGEALSRARCNPHAPPSVYTLSPPTVVLLSVPLFPSSHWFFSHFFLFFIFYSILFFPLFYFILFFVFFLWSLRCRGSRFSEVVECTK